MIQLASLNMYFAAEAFKHPIITPKVTMEHRKALVIMLKTTDGQHYYGECNAFETDWYADETINSVALDIQSWFDKYHMTSFYTFEDLSKSLKCLEHRPAARSTLVMALYSAFHTLTSFSIAYGATISGVNDDIVHYIEATQPQRIKLKYSSHIEADFQQLQRVAKALTAWVIDANESLSEQDIPTLERCKHWGISYIEEPFKQLAVLDELDVTCLPPIALDEKATSITAILDYVARYPIDYVVLKPFRLGGIDKVLEAMTHLRAQGVKCVVGGMYEYGLSRYYTAWLSQFGDAPGDVTPEGYYFKQDIVRDNGKLKDGRIYFTPPVVEKTLLHAYYLNG